MQEENIENNIQNFKEWKFKTKINIIKEETIIVSTLLIIENNKKEEISEGKNKSRYLYFLPILNKFFHQRQVFVIHLFIPLLILSLYIQEPLLLY